MEPVYTVEEVAIRLQVSQITVRRLCESDLLPQTETELDGDMSSAEIAQLVAALRRAEKEVTP